MSLENDIIYIMIEEKNRIRDVSDKTKEFYSNANLIENILQPNKKQNNLNNKYPYNHKKHIAKKKGLASCVEKLSIMLINACIKLSEREATKILLKQI